MRGWIGCSNGVAVLVEAEEEELAIAIDTSHKKLLSHVKSNS